MAKAQQAMSEHYPYVPPVEIVKPASRPKKKPGPKPGENRPYDAADRKLFPKLERLMEKKGMSLWAAALSLAENDKVAGRGTLESRAKRLCKVYREELEHREKMSED